MRGYARASWDICWRQNGHAIPFVNQTMTALRFLKSSSPTSPPWADGSRKDRAGSPMRGIVMRDLLTKKRQHEKRIAAPAGRFLYVTAPRQPSLGFRFVAALDRERGQPFVAREQELRLADRLRHVERPLVVVSARFVVATALIDLRQDDERNGKVITLSQPFVELDRRFRGAHAFIVVAGERAVTTGERAVEPGLLQLVADLLREGEAVAAVLERPPVVDRRVHHGEVRIGAARHGPELMGERRLQAARHEARALLDVTRSRERHAPRVVGVRDHVGGVKLGAERERAFRPAHGRFMVAPTKVDATEFLVESRRLDVRG